MEYISEPLSETDRARLQQMLSDYESFGHGCFCTIPGEFALRFLSGAHWVDVMISVERVENAEMEVYSQGEWHGAMNVALAPPLHEFVKTLYSSYYTGGSNKSVENIPP